MNCKISLKEDIEKIKITNTYFSFFKQFHAINPLNLRNKINFVNTIVLHELNHYATGYRNTY